MWYLGKEDEHDPAVQTGSPEWQQRYDLSISETDTGILCLVLEPTFFKAWRKTVDSLVKSSKLI